MSMGLRVQLRKSVGKRIETLPWDGLTASLHESGCALTPELLTPEECAALRSLYPQDELFRSHIVMERLRFGLGDYKYFKYPLPEIVEALRTHAYPYLAQVANGWVASLGDSTRFPATLAKFLKACHEAGQHRPTPLMLHYEKGGYNCLHQDIYGAVAFPLQMVIMLGQQGRDWTGGEFILVEQRPRAQSKAEVLTPNEGCAAIFTTRYRPVRGSKGFYRVNLRHGVSRVQSGSRYALGIIFHDGK